MHYQRHEQPGCGGCLLLALLLALFTGGAPALFNLLGMLMVSGLFGVLLLVAGFFAFSYSIRRRISTYESSQTETHNRFVHLLVYILVKIARSDGHFTKAEMAIITNFFQYSLRYNQDQMYWVKQLIKEARDAEENLDDLLREFRSSFNYEARLILLELIYQVIYAKEPVSDQELRLADNIAEFIQVTPHDHRATHARYAYSHDRQAAAAASSEEQCYAVLGLDNGADFDAIKKAYRTLSMQYHPDKVGHLGEEFKQVAEEKMKEINGAYDYFKKKFNGA